ncbi:hypothetical protein AB0M86_16000 [Streptomyces sp. NPDC051639]|uniref:hypothetical protein n=1 Tax=unclassified Streptomyces TaxID=2593676 RepID=UPI0033AFDEA4
MALASPRPWTSTTRPLLSTSTPPVLWDAPDVFRFDPAEQRLARAEFQLPEGVRPGRGLARLPHTLGIRPGGLHADEATDFRHEAPCCAAPPGDTVLTALRDPDVLDGPSQARVGIAPDVPLLV